MPKIFFVHWHEAEVKQRVRDLEVDGHEVGCHWSQAEHMRLGDGLPDIMVISLDRLPSHGRQIAEWLWEAKKRQHIPIIFAGGKPDKIEATRTKFPTAVYCETEDVPSAVRNLIAKRD